MTATLFYSYFMMLLLWPVLGLVFKDEGTINKPGEDLIVELWEKRNNGSAGWDRLGIRSTLHLGEILFTVLQHGFAIAIMQPDRRTCAQTPF
jgi:hypothetical protein